MTHQLHEEVDQLAEAVTAGQVKNVTQEVFERYPGKKLAAQIKNSSRWGSAGSAGADLNSSYMGMTWSGNWDTNKNQYRVMGSDKSKTTWHASPEKAARALRKLVRDEVRAKLEQIAARRAKKSA